MYVSGSLPIRVVIHAVAIFHCQSTREQPATLAIKSDISGFHKQKYNIKEQACLLRKRGILKKTLIFLLRVSHVSYEFFFNSPQNFDRLKTRRVMLKIR